MRIKELDGYLIIENREDGYKVFMGTIFNAKDGRWFPTLEEAEKFILEENQEVDDRTEEDFRDQYDEAVFEHNACSEPEDKV